MAFEDFEDGVAGDEITSFNSIFNVFFGGPEFTLAHVHTGLLAATGGDGFFFAPGESSMVYYLADAPSAEVWAYCDEGSGMGSPVGVLQETFGDVPNTSDGSYQAGIEYDPATDAYRMKYFDTGFGFQQVELRNSITSLGWLRLQMWAVDQTHRRFIIMDNAATVLADETVEIYDPALMPGGFQTTGYSLGVRSIIKGAPFEVTVDDFMCPIEEPPEFVGKPIRRVYPRGNPSRIYPPDRSQQRTNRAGGGTFF